MGGTNRRRGFALAVAAGAVAAAALADHAPLGAVDPTAQEQLGIYTLNRARNDPAAYGDLIGFDLSGVPAQPPLAVNRNLVGSARFHAAEMFDHHYYAHTSAISNLGANAMAVQNGYDAFGNGLGYFWGTTNSMESIARGVNTLPSVLNTLSALIIDKDVVGAGHRVHLLAMNSQFQDHREIGVGIATGTDAFPEFGLPKLLPTRLYAIHTANRGAGTQYLTGVVFRDRNGNLRYDPGEGLEGADISSSAGGSTESQAAGGWSLPASPGFAVITCSWGGWVARSPITVGSGNVEVDFHYGQNGGEVSFGFRSGLPASAGVYANTIYATGTAPFGVSFSAAGDFDHVAWELPGGGEAFGTTLVTSVDAPGLFPFRMVATSPNTWSSDVVVAVADAAGGAGEGTTLPASRDLGIPKGLLKRSFAVDGKDQAKLAATLELPGGFSPEGAEVQVCIGGAKGTFVLDAKGKAKDLATGSTFVLKAKYPVGAGVPPGTLAKATATLKGDLARALDATGLENRTAAAVDRTVPVAFWIDGVGYPAFALSTVTANLGKSGKAVIGPLPPE